MASEVDYRINGAGFRGPEPADRRTDVRRLAVFGDSIVFGWWVAERDAFPGEAKPAALHRPCSGYQPAEFAAVRGY